MDMKSLSRLYEISGCREKTVDTLHRNEIADKQNRRLFWRNAERFPSLLLRSGGKDASIHSVIHNVNLRFVNTKLHDFTTEVVAHCHDAIGRPETRRRLAGASRESVHL
ncbi:hypothetical protein K2D_33740 [Planctomycetes bacterium K2D]|uniref:Uncharacterized protein n=1 Tax=Botrimarina mediterranea TaxID=2528022 RepID=A0A518KBF0_9BACT|nr:hypothetical protein Spa11_33230 [Botrimarina mediterranea]QDV79758.1 hypothetical protein K2D_33740 [Planctomycetes bacterium K2D]